MRKTLLLTHEYYPFAGGVARYCYNLFKYFPTTDYLVVCDHPQVVSRANIIHLQLKDNLIWPSWLLAFFRLRKIIRQNKIEQIFTPNILPLGTIAYMFYKLYKIPYIVSLHGLDINLALKHKPKLAKSILAAADKIIVNTKYTASLIQGLNLSPEKIIVIYPSVAVLPKPDVQLQSQLKEKYHIKSSDRILLTVGRLVYRKGHDLVIRALADLKRTDVKYLIVGQGYGLASLKQLVAQKKLDQQIIFCSEISDQALAAVYGLADIFVLPNRYRAADVEGFGMVFLEAAQYGLPIIAGKSGGVLEILTDKQSALLVDSDSLAQLKLALTTILGNAELAKKLGEQARLRSRDFLSDVEQSKKLKDIL
ncbi:MAG: glycosyltransferase family 4 protein [Patescibacteria group bacterium]